jgi:hypothetical protein
MARVVELVSLHALVLPDLRALPSALHPSKIAVAIDGAVAMVALVKGDDKEVLRALAVGSEAPLAHRFDEAVREGRDRGVCGTLCAAVKDENDGQTGGAGRRNGEGGEAEDVDREAADRDRVRCRER